MKKTNKEMLESILQVLEEIDKRLAIVESKVDRLTFPSYPKQRKDDRDPFPFGPRYDNVAVEFTSIDEMIDHLEDLFRRKFGG